mgnify:CR=1 FL=1
MNAKQVVLFIFLMVGCGHVAEPRFLADASNRIVPPPSVRAISHNNLPGSCGQEIRKVCGSVPSADCEKKISNALWNKCANEWERKANNGVMLPHSVRIAVEFLTAAGLRASYFGRFDYANRVVDLAEKYRALIGAEAIREAGALP